MKKKVLQAENILPIKFHCLFVTTSIIFKTQKAGIPQIFTKPHNPPRPKFFESHWTTNNKTANKFARNKALATCFEALLLLKNYTSPTSENS